MKLDDIQKEDLLTSILSELKRKGYEFVNELPLDLLKEHFEFDEEKGLAFAF